MSWSERTVSVHPVTHPWNIVFKVCLARVFNMFLNHLMACLSSPLDYKLLEDFIYLSASAEAPASQ